MYIDTHVHSTFSPDGKSTPRDQIEAAIKTNLSGICFTEHLDEENSYEPNDCDFKNYIPEIAKLKEEYKGKIDIFTGVEIGIQPRESVIMKTLGKINGFSFDYITGSTHLVKNLDPYYPEYYVGKTKFEVYGDMICEITKNIVLWDKCIDGVSHFDYIMRYVPFTDKNLYYNEFSDKLDVMLKEIITRGKALEINTGSYVDADLDPLTIKRYKELGGELITLGSDAHKACNIGYKFEKYANLIKDCGFKYLTHFENRKPIQVRI